MRILISPAKKMRVDGDSLAPTALPRFLEEAEILKNALTGLTAEERRRLWGCSEAIAQVNEERLRLMDLFHAVTPAILAYEGIQYQYMAPGVLERKQLDYLQEHLRIGSGLYGLLCPFDSVAPYRLEMQAKLKAAGKKDLYDFWGGKPAEQLAAETDWIVNLASKEYSKAVWPHLPRRVGFISCVFGEKDAGGRVIEKGTLCKMARGQMVRWMAENHITRPQELCGFEEAGYRYQKAVSTEDQYIFIKGADRKC